MLSNSYTRDILVSNTPSAAYKALTSEFDKWWTSDSDKLSVLGDTITFRFGDTFWRMQATSLSPDYIELLCIEAHHVHNGLTSTILKEWEGTKLKWVIEKQHEKTRISFIHEGLIPSLACYEICKEGWDYFFVQSLQKYLDEGMGMPTDA